MLRNTTQETIVNSCCFKTDSGEACSAASSAIQSDGPDAPDLSAKYSAPTPIGPNQPTNPASRIERISGIARWSRNTDGRRRRARTAIPNRASLHRVIGLSRSCHWSHGSAVPRVVNTATSSNASMPSEKCECRS